MNLDRNNIPEEYMCELCQPRRVDRARARAIQHRKRQEFRLSTPPPSVSLERARNKDRNRNDEYVDVEKTPKKFQRTYSAPGSGAKYGRGGAKSAERHEKLHKPGKRAGQAKWKRRGSERQDDAVPRKRKASFYQGAVRSAANSFHSDVPIEVGDDRRRRPVIGRRKQPAILPE